VIVHEEDELDVNVSALEAVVEEFSVVVVVVDVGGPTCVVVDVAVTVVESG